MSIQEDTLFRVRFYHEDNIYEIYARSLGQEAIFGFIEVEEIVFGENSGIVVDPAEEKLKQEFQDVICTYIPTHAVIRIDEVKKQGLAKISQIPKDGNNKIIRPFPAHTYQKNKQPD